jgi:hypothetical protein
MAEQWEYMSATLQWDDEGKQWRVVSPSGTSLRGDNFGAALNVEGEQGWECISIVPFGYQWQHWRTLGSGDITSTQAIDNWRVDGYRAVFKRRKQP